MEDVEETRQRLSQQTLSLNGALADPPLGPVACTFSNQAGAAERRSTLERNLTLRRGPVCHNSSGLYSEHHQTSVTLTQNGCETVGSRSCAHRGDIRASITSSSVLLIILKKIIAIIAAKVCRLIYYLAKPISLVERCYCRSTVNNLPRGYIRELRFIHTPNCPFQVIAKLKTNKEVCLNPEIRWLQQYLKNAINKQHKKARQTKTPRKRQQ
ncbi:hypothetical protein INR49_001048, partial [Caranx melampygus]